MVVFNPVKKEIDIKIVYYGPALCGKTTNLQSVHLNLNPKQRGELVSLATKDDRTLFFDFLPIELDNIKGFKTRFHIYTVPGQVFYTLTRKAVLTGVDGIIFVADSQESKMEENIESMDDLKENLKYYNKTLDSLPFVIQYNKRDLDNLISLLEMDRQLNHFQAPTFEACAISGKGVMETLTMCCKMVLKQIQDRSSTEKTTPKREPVPQEENTPPAELPQLTLTEELLPSERSVGDSPPFSGTIEQEDIPIPPLREVAQGGTETTVTRSASEDPIRNRQPEPGILDNLLDKEPEIQFDNSALPADETDQLPLVNETESLPGIPASPEQLQGDEIPEEPDIQPSAAAEVPSPGEIIEEEKRTCPRCSLKFKPHVRMCPICKISLLPNGEDQETPAPEISHHETSVPPNLEQSQFPQPAGSDQRETPLEIVACGQPSRTSSHAISVPLIMKMDDTDSEFTVNLSVSFGKVLLK